MVKVYLGLEDLEEGSPFELRHQTHGKVVGGSPVEKKVRDLLKIVEYIDFSKRLNSNNSAFLDYIIKERQFVHSMENASTSDTTIYE